MRNPVADLLPKRPFHGVRHPSSNFHASQLLLEAAATSPNEALRVLRASAEGLTETEARDRRRQFGPNAIAPSEHRTWRKLWTSALVNPLVILLAVLGSVSIATGDLRSAAVIWLMLLLGVMLRIVQEARADSAVARLKAMIRVTATVRRDGELREAPLADLVPGDVISLSAGDMVPADVRVLTCKELFVNQASLTGEAFPVEKFSEPVGEMDADVLAAPTLCFLGASVETGSASALVVQTGLRTYLGGISQSLAAPQSPTAFDQGISRFTWLMIRLLLTLTPLVFLINGLSKGDWREAFFFALAVAVGLTPEMLPMIVTVCLSKGAIAMARQKAIVKRLNSIQNCGAMDVLCTDKTGTLTIDRVILQRHCDLADIEDVEVFVLAFINSHFQTGLKNVLDRAVLKHREAHPQLTIPEYKKIDEIPFDFSRKCMSVVVDCPDGKRRLICKGAPEAMFGRCNRFELQGELRPIDAGMADDFWGEFARLSNDGFRVLAIAYREVDQRPAYGKQDEENLILRGYVAFLDPPKDTASRALSSLAVQGVSVKVLTGDNELVTRNICREVGLKAEEVLLGNQVEAMSDAELTAVAVRVALFARLTPAHKERVIKALRSAGHVVGYLGDGVNDVSALRAADVGISVDNAVDIAKETADIILLEKSLLVLVAGVVEGRKVYANILKYARMGASSNFGNMLSVLGASIFLPFLPMTPLQILTNNLLYDFSQVPIPTDEVDPEQVARPRPWSMNEIFRFILWIGPCSSIFDYSTFFIMLYFFECWYPGRASLFQTGWFVESLLTQTLIIHVIRTNRIPFLESRASWPLMIITIAVMAVGAWLPGSALGAWLGFTLLPGLYWPFVGLTLIAYVALTQFVKRWLLKRGWI